MLATSMDLDHDPQCIQPATISRVPSPPARTSHIKLSVEQGPTILEIRLKDESETEDPISSALHTAQILMPSSMEIVTPDTLLCVKEERDEEELGDGFDILSGDV